MSGKVRPKCAESMLAILCALPLAACSGGDAPEPAQVETVEAHDPVVQLVADNDLDGLVDFFIAELRRGDVSVSGDTATWSPVQERARDALTNLVVKDPSVYGGVSESLRPRQFAGYNDDWSGMYAAEALLKHVAAATLAGLVAKEDLEGVIDFRAQLAADGVSGRGGKENHKAANELMSRLTRQDASMHARVDAKLVALRESSTSESVRTYATRELEAINEHVYSDRREELLRYALETAGLDPSAELIAPPNEGSQYSAPKTILSGLEVDVLFHWLKPPLQPVSPWMLPELWKGEGHLRGKSKAEIDAYFDGITHVGLYLYESSRNVGNTYGKVSDGTECTGFVIQSIYYAYRIGLEDDAVEGMRLMGHVNPPGQTYLDKDCNTTAGLPIYSPFVVRDVK